MAKKKVDKKKKVEKKFGESFGISGFTLGVLSIIFAFIVPLFGIIFALVGFTLCFIQQKKNPTKKGKTGLILNIIGLVIGIALWIITITILYPLIEDQLANFPA